LSRATPKSPSLAAIVKREDAEAALKRIICLGLLDKSRKVIRREDRVEIPVLGELGEFDMVVQDRPSFYRKLPDLTAALRATAKGTGLVKSAGKEDPVELDSSLTLRNGS